jgi:hypothetical protein
MYLSLFSANSYGCRRWIYHWNSSQGVGDCYTESFLAVLGSTLNSLQDYFEDWVQELGGSSTAREIHSELESVAKLHNCPLLASKNSTDMDIEDQLFRLGKKMQVS